MPSEQSGRLEETLTWNEANTLRLIMNDRARELHGALLVAQAEGLPHRNQQRAYTEARLLEQKVLDLFRRVSEGR